MPRLPSTSCAPRPTRASRTRVFTGLDSEWGNRGAPGQGADQRAGGRGVWAAVRRGGQRPGQAAVQTRSRSTWIRPTRSTAVAATDICLPGRSTYATSCPTLRDQDLSTSLRIVTHETRPASANRTAQIIIAVL